MAESNSYPMLSANNWWNIRKKFKQTIPGTVTASYLSSVLNMQDAPQQIISCHICVNWESLMQRGRLANELSYGETILIIQKSAMR